MKYTRLLLLVCSLAIGYNRCFGEDGILDKITSGFNLAKKLLGLDRVKGISQLVSEAFARDTERNNDQKESGTNIFSGFLRIFGFDVKKIGAIAVNAIIFVAQLISTSLGKNAPPPVLTDETAREIKEGDPFQWLSTNTHISDVLNHVQNKNLSEHVIEYIKEYSADEDTDCLQLLVCRLSPFVTTMQESLRRKPDETGNGKDLLFKYLPSIEDISEIGDRCETKHPYCKLLY